MFGEKLRKLRTDLGLSQTELGNVLETSNANVSNWENGVSEPDFDMLKKIALFFNVPTDYLLDINREDLKKLTNSLKEAGIMVKDDITKEDLEKALQIIEILKATDFE